MIVYSLAIDVSTLCAPLESLNASADRIKLIQTCCTEISTNCTWICIPIFRYQLHNNETSNFIFKGTSDVADALNFTEIILSCSYDDYSKSYYNNGDSIKSLDVIE
jgi:hypothetical protein